MKNSLNFKENYNKKECEKYIPTQQELMATELTNFLVDCKDELFYIDTDNKESMLCNGYEVLDKIGISGLDFRDIKSAKYIDLDENIMSVIAKNIRYEVGLLDPVSH